MASLSRQRLSVASSPEDEQCPPSPSASNSNPPKATESGVSRAKRGKYTSRACEYCHRRKIKCKGDIPCQACVIKQRQCTKISRASALNGAQQAPKEDLTLDTEEIRENDTGNTDSVIGILLGKFSRVERQLEALLLQSISRSSDEPQDWGQVEPTVPVLSSAVAGIPREIPESRPDSRNADFVGETSINKTLQHMEDCIQGMSAGSAGSHYLSTDSPSNFLGTVASPCEPVSDQNRILRVLYKYGLTTTTEDWAQLLDLYREEVYPLYPFIHLPSLQRSYDELLDLLDGSNCSTYQRSGRSLSIDPLVQLLICLGLGRCTTSARAEAKEGPDSAGWTFYCAATDLLGDLLDPLGSNQRGLLRMQTLTLMTIYVIRLDANERAQRVLSLAVAHAHHLGLHRESILMRLPIFQAEASRRVYWCIYLLDRRLALDLGCPFMIQDINIDTKLPFQLSDAWLEDHRDSSLTVKTVELPVDEVSGVDTPIPYLIAMIGYSKIVAKVWDALYRADAIDRASSPQLFESLEALLSMWRNSLPQMLSCSATEPHLIPPGLAHNWQVKHRFLIHMRSVYLQILIRKPMRRHVAPDEWLNNFENETKCADLANSTLELFSHIFEPYRMCTYPFLQYLLGSASIVLGLIIKEPTFRMKYGRSVIRAAQMINVFCKRTWVSGKSARSIARFNQIVYKILSQDGAVMNFDADAPPPSHLSSYGHHTENMGSSKGFSDPQQKFSMPSPAGPQPPVTSNARRGTANSPGRHPLTTVQGGISGPYPPLTPSKSPSPEAFASSSPLLQWPHSMTSDFPFEVLIGCDMAQDQIPFRIEGDPTYPLEFDWLDRLMDSDSGFQYTPEMDSRV